MLRDGVRKRMRYGQCSVDHTQQLYEVLRQHIITELALHNPDGTVDAATRNVPTLGSTEDWIPSCRLSDFTNIQPRGRVSFLAPHFAEYLVYGPM